MIRILLVLTTALLLGAPALGAEVMPTDLSKLIEAPQRYDQQTVTIQGEVIGDVLHRRKHVWLNVNSNGTAMGIWTPEQLARQIKNIGDYDHRGDTVRLSGLFNRACPIHGGDMDIHADSIGIIAYGERIIRPIPGWELLVTVLLSLIGAVLFVFDLRRRRQKSLIKERPF